MNRHQRTGTADVLVLAAVALDRAADDVRADQLTPERADELADSLGTVVGILRDRAGRAGRSIAGASTRAAAG